MPCFSAKQSLAALLLAVPPVFGTNDLNARPDTDSLVGSYGFHSGCTPHDISIDVVISLQDDQYILGFDGAYLDAHGASPEGGGTGQINPRGVFQFTYEDAFSNKGRGTFQKTRMGYKLTIEIREVADARCLRFYGTFVLHRNKSEHRSGVSGQQKK